MNQVTYLTGWWVYWEKNLAYKALDAAQWIEYNRDSDSVRFISTIELPYPVRELAAPGSFDKEVLKEMEA